MKKYLVVIETELEERPIIVFFHDLECASNYLKESLIEIHNFPANAQGCIYSSISGDKA